MKERLDRKQFLLYALKLAFPIMIQNPISTLVNSADTIMLGYVSQTAMAASSLANQYTFVLFCFYYGLGIGTSVLCAQYFGKGDKQTVERIIGLAARVAILISLLFFVFSFFAPEAIMKIFSDSPQTIKEGAAYLKVLSFSFVFMGFSQVFVSALRSVGKIVFPSALYVVSLLVNVLMNAAFIFGLFGLPRLGVVGVALGTVSARAVEVILCFVYSAAGKDIKFRLKNLFRRSGVLFDMVAANAVAVMVVNMGAIVCRGFSNATTIIVSQTLGENRMEDTKVYAKRILWLTVIVSLLGCCVILAIRPFMVQFYRDKLTETAIYYLGIIMIMTTWRLVGEGINTCLICGCFRGGGDAKFGMVVDTVFMWGVSVPLMAIAAYVLKLPPVWVYFVMTLDEFEKMPVVFAHYFKFKWMKNITRDQKELEG